MRIARLIILLLMAVAVTTARAEVKVYEQPLTLPTYKIGEPEMMPYWDKIYPYTMYERLSDEKFQKTYKALYVENEWVKALVLPEIGGRLHGAQDKTNGYQFLYDQTTIKPGLVGMAGAWISGGVEWNFPHGHRPTGFRDTDYRLVNNPDGSSTAWAGEIDRMYGMRWAVGTTVHPGRNWVETKVRLYNSSPYAHSFQMWATAAVRATQEYQAVIPGEIVTGHGKHDFHRWPVHDGVDITYWKNNPGATSYFAWESEAAYFGGYSPEKQAGMVHFGDPHIVRGKKLWTWGAQEAGRIWEKILTDGDIAYYEPQAGAYSDNQPDYHWIQPGETKVYSHFWFPVRDIGVWDFANLEGALNLELDGRKVKFGWSPTGTNKGATVVVTYAGEELYRQSVDADPATPFLGEAKAPRKADLYELSMTVLSADGEPLLGYSHPRPTNPPIPDPEVAPDEPGEMKSIDELFITGDYYDMFRSKSRARRYYDEALRRDPGDVRTNTAIGLSKLKQGLYCQAVEHFDLALKRYPDMGKARYYKGMAHLRDGDLYLAEKHLNRASYDLTYYAAAHFELAQLTAAQGRYERALDHIQRSINGNGDNVQAWAVKAHILNRLERTDEALVAADKAQEMDPLDLLSLCEKIYVSYSKDGNSYAVEQMVGELLGITRLDNENHLELAIRFARLGDYRSAVLTLKAMKDSEEKVSPMVYYYQAYYSSILKDKYAADGALSQAIAGDPTYVFPNRLESYPVLNWALEQNPDDGKARYFLGNLLRSQGRLDEALASWEKSVERVTDNAVVWHNIGQAYAISGDLDKAETALRKAVEINPGAAMAVEGLDKILQSKKVSNEQRITLLEKYDIAINLRDPLLKRLISMYVQEGRYENALGYLEKHHFHSWEGRYDVHQYWVESNLGMGDKLFADGDYDNALKYYQLSLTYPFNLEVAPQPNVIHARKEYKIASALEALGKKREARKHYKTVAAYEMAADNAYQYYRGKALVALGKKDEAGKVYQQMLTAVENSKQVRQRHESHFDPGRNFEALKQYKISLALEGLGRESEAKSKRQQAIDQDPISYLRAFSPPRAGW
jgi:tetratricopeptide (TPR) repeat protein